MVVTLVGVMVAALNFGVLAPIITEALIIYSPQLSIRVRYALVCGTKLLWRMSSQ
jgi:hypothetical protein